MPEEVVTIEKMSYGSDAIAHASDGKTLFVQGGVPGDKVSVKRIEEKKSYDRVCVSAIIEPSSDRLDRKDFPQCVAECGGCPWAYMSYDAQLAHKTSLVKEALTRGAKMAFDEVDSIVKPCLPSKNKWHYRNKIELSASHNASGKLVLGFHEQGSEKLFGPSDCPLGHEKLSSAMPALQGALRFLEKDGDLGISRVGVRA
ncbi:MAG: class I SAM-dependent RNA methyltransferase, partial [Eggerthellaceae bacterium]|nr:class I SAM-dependent RNA methyltransferase [Eggerthellaceae bacterium]